MWAIGGTGAVVAQKVDGVQKPQLTAGQGDAYFNFAAGLSSSYYGATSKPQVDGVSVYTLIKV